MNIDLESDELAIVIAWILLLLTAPAQAIFFLVVFLILNYFDF